MLSFEGFWKKVFNCKEFKDEDKIQNKMQVVKANGKLGHKNRFET